MNTIEKQDNFPKIFVGNVPFQCTADEFRDCFKNMAGFVEAHIINKYNSEFSRGFGFVTFDNVNNAQQLLNSQIMCKDRLLRFTEYNFKNKLDKNYLFVRNVPKTLKRDELANMFKTFGEIGACFIATNIKTGESKGTGVVEIIDDKIYEELLNKKIINYNNIVFEVAKFKNKNVKSENIIKPIKPIKHVRQNISNAHTDANVNKTKELYRMAFNTGNNAEHKGGLQIAKNCFYLENEEFID